MNHLAIVVAALAAFIGSCLCYLVFGQEFAKVGPAFAARQPAAWKMVAVFAGNLVRVFVVAYIIVQIGIVTWTGAVGIGILLWLGLSAV